MNSHSQDAMNSIFDEWIEYKSSSPNQGQEIQKDKSYDKKPEVKEHTEYRGAQA